MNTSRYKKEQQEMFSDLLDSTGSFFAFTEQQFNQSKKEGVTYTYVSNLTLYVPSDKVDEFLRRYKEIDTETKRQRSLIDMDVQILDALNNYEAFYNGELEETYEEIKSIFSECTMDDVIRVYNKNNKEDEE